MSDYENILLLPRPTRGAIRAIATHGLRAARACCFALPVWGLTLTSGALADDTEIYRLVVDTETSRPKVLIVFDDSGSMDFEVVGQRAAYNPSTTYPAVSGIQSERLYWATGSSGLPPAATTSQWFNAQKNRCGSSYGPLGSNGFYAGNFARWSSTSSTSWRGLSNSENDPLHIECAQDVTDRVTENGSGTGSPGAGYPRSTAPRPYGTERQRSVDDDWSSYRVYSANYMNWYHGTPVPATRTRLEIAQEVIASIVNSNTGIDFGLAVFNRNYDSSYNGSSSYDGGRIVQRIIENMSTANRTNLVNIVNGLEADGSTPICESVYEAYRYLSGGRVLYGYEKYSGDTPGRDTNAESGSNYMSPTGDCQYAYIILMTDGEPQYDTDANARIRTLTGKTCRTYRDANGNMTENCLPEIAEYMYNTDLDGDPANGEQKGILYTIGFTTSQQLLQDAAAKGGGLYYTADNAEELTAAFQGAITSILATDSTFTSPAVAANNFTRTETRNEVFFAMFRPTNGTNWPGNIKKLRIDPADGTLLDRNGNTALTNTGDLRDSAMTYWGSGGGDGANIEAGGVGGMLAARNPDTRTIKTNTGTLGALQDFTAANLNKTALGLATDRDLYDLFQVADATELTDLLAWARGWTSAAKVANREWVMGDILHSTPIVLDYGERTSAYSLTSPDLRIVAGTNAGFLHMFSNADGTENWAFFPKELATMLKDRRSDLAGGATVYGVDGEVSVYRHDANRDGSIKASDGDKMYLFFGLRRGGTTYYALDVTNPDSPSLLWQISKATSGFAELGQTWSTPVITMIPGHLADDGKPKPVLVFGGGYDAANDDRLTTASEVADIEGRGVFIVDASTGALVWSATPATGSSTNLQVTGMVHAIPAQLSVRDSNGDGLTDRIYAADVGGNIWRIDLAGANKSNWRAFKFAALAGEGHAGDRRFFNKVDSVSTRKGSQIYDAVLIGSGDRTNPNSTDNDDRFYMLKDFRTVPYSAAANCVLDPSDPRCTPITNADLFDATSNVLQEGTDAQRTEATSDLSTAKGWYINLNAGDGEKALSESFTLTGRVVFTTFSPDSSTGTLNRCVPTPGTARLYAVRLQDGTAVIDFTNDDQLTAADRFLLVGSSIADVPGIHVAGDGTVRLILPPGSGGGGAGGGGASSGTGGCIGPACEEGEGFTRITPVPVGTYWYN